MIFDAIFIAAGTVGLLVGQAITPALPADWGALIQGGAFAVLAFAFLHMLVKTLPQRDKAYTDAVNAIAERQARATQELANAIVDLRLNCAARFAEDKQYRDPPK